MSACAAYGCTNRFSKKIPGIIFHANVKNITKLNETELAKGTIDKKSWHDLYKDSAWIFIGGLAYGLTEGDIITVFSQYGEVVNINLVRDKKTGKTKGFCFLCYANQKSTVLAVDNFNGIKLCGRTIRVDHVANYKPPKENEQDDELTKLLKSEGCAPKLIKQEPPSDSTEEKHKKKKSKKEKKHKKKKKRSETDSPIHIKVEQDSSDGSTNMRNGSTEQDQRNAKEMYAKDLKRFKELQQESESDTDDVSKSRNKNKYSEINSSRYENYEFPSSTKSDNHRHSSPQRKKSVKSHSKHHISKNSKSSTELIEKNASRLSSKEKYETHKNIWKKKKGKRDYNNEPSSSTTDSDSRSRDKYSHKKDTKKRKRHDSSSSTESSQDLRDDKLHEKKRPKSHETEKYSVDSHSRYDYNKHYDKEEKSHANKHRQNSTTSELNKNDARSCHDKYKSVNKRTSRNDDYDQYNHSVNSKKRSSDHTQRHKYNAS